MKINEDAQRVRVDTTRAVRACVAGGVTAVLALSTAGVMALPKPAAAVPQYVCQHPGQSSWVDDAGTIYIEAYCMDEWWPADPVDPSTPSNPNGGSGGTGNGGDTPNVCPPYTPRGYQQAFAAVETAVSNGEAAVASAQLSLADAQASLATDNAALGPAETAEDAALANLTALTADLDPTGGSKAMRLGAKLQMDIQRADNVYRAAKVEVSRLQGDLLVDHETVTALTAQVETLQIELADARAHLDHLQTCQ